MATLRRLVSCLTLLVLLIGSSTARPVPEPFSFTGLLGDIKAGVTTFIDKFLGVPSTVRGKLSPDLMPDFLYFAEFSAAAYCDPNHVAGSKVTCPKGICPTIQKNTVTTIYEFAEGLSDTTGIIARDDSTKAIILAFRGSHSVRNWLVNLDLERRAVPWCAGCMIHSGFYSAYMEEAVPILSILAKLASDNPTYRIVTTGHSLGGALAQIAAADLRMRGYTVTAFTYGSPRIGNENLSKFVSQSGTNYRITHLDDPVPRLPLFTTGYMHVSPEYHIVKDGVGANGIDIVDGYLNFGGNTAANGLVSINILAHLKYLTNTGIADCAPTLFEIRRMLE